MSLLALVILLVVVGVALYLVQMIPMDATIKRVIVILVVAVTIIYVLVKFVAPLLSSLKL